MLGSGQATGIDGRPSPGDHVGGEAVAYAELVKRVPTLRQSYVAGYARESSDLEAAAAACHPWRQQAQRACSAATHEAASSQSCARLQVRFTLCMGELAAPRAFERLRHCLEANGNDIGHCEAPLLAMADQLAERKTSGPEAGRAEHALLTRWEQQRLAECSLTGAQQSEIDCMIPSVCPKEHKTMRACLKSRESFSSSSSSYSSPSSSSDASREETDCVGPAKEALYCWGAFNRRRERTEQQLQRHHGHP